VIEKQVAQINQDNYEELEIINNFNKKILIKVPFRP